MYINTPSGVQWLVETAKNIISSNVQIDIEIFIFFTILKYQSVLTKSAELLK